MSANNFAGQARVMPGTGIATWLLFVIGLGVTAFGSLAALIRAHRKPGSDSQT